MPQELNNFTYKGKTFTKGMPALINAIGEECGIGNNGDRVTILVIIGEPDSHGHVQHDHGHVQLGMTGEHHHHWHDLEGRCGPKNGYWLTPDDAERGLTITPEDAHITKDVEFRGKNLKDMKCRILSSLGDGSIFVELEEDVGGMSCDGLGKRGHCVVISRSAIGMKEEDRPDKSGKGVKKKHSEAKAKVDSKKKKTKKTKKAKSFLVEVSEGKHVFHNED